MIRLIKKVLGVILSVTIIASSAGITIVNHFCKEEQRIYVGVDGVFHNICLHQNETLCCCENQSLNHIAQQGNESNRHSIKPYDNCCREQRIIQKVPIVSSERKIVDLFQNFVSFEYIKKSISEYLRPKIELIQTKVINPIKKIIRFIRIISRSFSTKESTL